MNMELQYPWQRLSTWYIVAIVLLILWDAIWKAIALWKAARNNQLSWFVVFLIFNTAGILPIVYIKFFQRKKLPL
ncbi:MAG: DUF5652 family protein [Candidatus Dojkabacteria bacterium]|nr:DUF5652 family protein [Candidatus Dojkabacteria bacterium]